MPLLVTQNWGNPTLTGTVAFHPFPSGNVVKANIVGGLLVDAEGNVGVTLASSEDPNGPQRYLAKFADLYNGLPGQQLAIPRFAFSAGSDVVLGNVFPNITPTVTGTVPVGDSYRYSEATALMSQPYSSQGVPAAAPQFVQSPGAVLDYTLDWKLWLADTGDTIASAKFIPNNSEITVVSVNTTDSTVTGWLTGGVDGQNYSITVHIVTNYGRQDERTFTLSITQT